MNNIEHVNMKVVDTEENVRRIFYNGFIVFGNPNCTRVGFHLDSND